jgi:hypothetical protein
MKCSDLLYGQAPDGPAARVARKVLKAVESELCCLAAGCGVAFAYRQMCPDDHASHRLFS